MASPGPAPPCVQATPVKEPDRRARREPTKPEVARGKGSHPARPLDLALVWETQTATGGRGSAPEGADRGPKTPGRPPFTFITPLGLVRPMTRTHVRLLGPCFKTGRVGHRPFARRERETCCSSAARPSQGCQDTGGFPLRRRERTTSGYQSTRAFDVPSNGSRRPTSRGEIRPPAPAWMGARPRVPGSHQRIPPPSRLWPTS